MSKEFPPSAISFTLTFAHYIDSLRKILKNSDFLHQRVFKKAPASIAWGGNFIDTKTMKMMIYWCKIHFKAMIYQ